MAPQEECGLIVRFGSYAMGIDRMAAEQVERILAAGPGVKEISRSSTGREGEYGLCVKATSQQAAASLFARIKSSLPANPRGPITVKAGSLRYAVPRKR